MATIVKVVQRTDKYGNREDFDRLLKRFKKSYQESGILSELRKREYAKSPSQKRKEKSKLAEARRRKEERKAARYVVAEN